MFYPQAARDAKSLELRAATSLARLYLAQGDRGRASRVLAPILGWFTESLATCDLVTARALIG